MFPYHFSSVDFGGSHLGHAMSHLILRDTALKPQGALEFLSEPRLNYRGTIAEM